MEQLQLWGGAECTVNRVGDSFRDQLRETGHHHRPEDLDLFADLGITALRFPILWERAAPDAPRHYDWSWIDDRLQRLRGLGIRPIGGLVHHGSGPRYTNLLAADFPSELGRYAADVIERYPWITDWTPINEPLTTARFCALYGHWYPHRRDERSFWLALLNEVDATCTAMKAIRRVQPAARLIQTDDLGRTYATVAVRDQAAFNNVRRWMGWDLLCGRVVPGHDMWTRLVEMGFEGRLRSIAENPCVPDLIGINHYLTSDRFLDHRVQRYPAFLRGGNGRDAYVDTEALRALQPTPSGLEVALRDAWQRYRIPIAITEVHNGCTREEQMRWTVEAWGTAQALRGEGMAIEALTCWALLGSRGWDRLLTGEGRYEPGAFDVSSGAPRATALAGVLKSLAAGQEPSHPVLAGAGWWRRPIRLHHPAVPRPAPLHQHRRGWTEADADAPPILITGATGTLGRAMAAACEHRAIAHVLTDRSQLDLADQRSITAALDEYRPWAVINTAGWVRVDEAETEREACMAANADGAARLATACGTRGIPSVNFSSDLVFGGRADRPYHEGDRPDPLNVYGLSKARAEQAIAAMPGSHLVVRTAAFFSPFDRFNFAVHLVEALNQGRIFRAASDQVISPTYVPDLCGAVLDLLIDGESGVWHLTNGQDLSWAEFGRALAGRCDLDPALVEPCPGTALGWSAARPSAVPLRSVKGRLLPSLDDAIERFASEIGRSERMANRSAA